MSTICLDPATENQEMLYQFEYDYRFDSSTVASASGLEARPYREGIAAALSRP